MANRRGSYSVKRLHDELIQGRGKTRPAVAQRCKILRNLSVREIEEYKAEADLAIKLMGIACTGYSDQVGCIDRTRPFDIMSRKAWEASIRCTVLAERTPGRAPGRRTGTSTVGRLRVERRSGAASGT